MTTEPYWFKSSLFEVEPGEDKDINPGIYGRQLALWLQARLQEQGYQIDEVFTEDWGWCLVCSREPFFLSAGCSGSREDGTLRENDVPPKEEVLWYCLASAERCFWKNLFRKIDMQPALAKLEADLLDILRNEPEIMLLSETVK